MTEKISKVFALSVLSLIVIYYIIILYNLFIVPNIIMKRFKNLGTMEYDSSKDKMIPKDSVTLTRGDIYYIKHGTTTYDE